MSKPFGEELLFQKAELGTLTPDEQRSLAKRGRERLSRMAGWCEEAARLRDEVSRLRLTDEERGAVTLALDCLRDSPHTALYQTISAASTCLRGLLERTK